jgi:hypothetical protein
MKSNRVTKPAPSSLESCVDRYFEIAEDRDNAIRENPFTKASFMPEFDSIRVQKEAAKRALAAKWWFGMTKPGDLPALPIDPRERSAIKYDSPLHWLLVSFTSSWECNRYSMQHPDFETYTRAVMACPRTPDFIRANPELLRRFSPTLLPSLGDDLFWRPTDRPRCDRVGLVRRKSFNRARSRHHANKPPNHQSHRALSLIERC